MTDDDAMPDRFSKLHCNDLAENRVAADLGSFERERLRWLLTRLKISRAQQNQIARTHQTATGRFELRFSTFNEVFPTFPFVLGASKLQNLVVPHGPDKSFTTPANYAVHRDAYSTEPARFKKFHWVPFAKAFRDFYETVTSEARVRKVCLVFPRKGFREGMCIHNDDTETYWEEGLCWVYKIPKTGNKLFIQPFNNLVDAIHANGRGWRVPR